MLQVCRGADFAREPVDPKRFGKLRSEDLDRYWTVVPEIAGEIDRCRTALTELALDAIAVLQ